MHVTSSQAGQLTQPPTTESVDRQTSNKPSSLTPQAPNQTTKTQDVQQQSKFSGPWGGRFAQQQLKGWRPRFTLSSMVVLLLPGMLMSAVLGVTCLLAALHTTRYRVHYDDAGPWSPDAAANQTTAVVEVNITRDMQPPIYLYYILDNFKGNHKRYIRSVNWAQLAGASSGGADNRMESCEPQRYLSGKPRPDLPNNGQVNPCGLRAWSYFNDTFLATQICEGQGSGGSVIEQPLELDDSELVFREKADHLFGNHTAVNFNTIPEYRGGGQLHKPLAEERRFHVWMVPPVHADLQNLYGVIRQPLKGGCKVRFAVANRYNSYKYRGAKILLLTTQNFLGAPTLLLGCVFLAMTGLAVLGLIGLGVLVVVKGVRRPGDMANAPLQQTCT